jgi:hypothetical protein
VCGGQNLDKELKFELMRENTQRSLEVLSLSART